MSLTAHGGGLVTGLAGSTNKFTVFTKDNNITGLTVAFEGPSKPEINFHNNKDGSVEVQYKPKCEGHYKIHVKFNNKDIIGSPFKCHISGDIGQSRALVSKVKCSGANLTSGKAHFTNEFLVDCKEAGITGGLNIAMEGPSKAEVNFVDNKDGTLTVKYKPETPGQYKIHLKFGDLHLPGSPFPLDITA